MFPLIFTAIGAITSVIGAAVQAKAANDQSVASQKAEALRQQQMTLESNRQRIMSVRNMLAARSAGLLAASSQGAQFGSGEAGSQSSIGAKTADNITSINQAESIGNGIFGANAQISQAGALASFGGGLESLGHTISGLKVQ